MKRGRPVSPIPTIDWKVYIPVPIAAKVDLLLLDPVTMRQRHGARSALVGQLLLKWLATQGYTPDPAIAKTLVEPIDKLPNIGHDTRSI